MKARTWMWTTVVYLFAALTISIQLSAQTIAVDTLATAQDKSDAAQSVPRLVRFSGKLTDTTGKPASAVSGVTFALYKDQEGGAALWLETQNVNPDVTGRYTVTLGAVTSGGIPSGLFASGEAQWLGIRPDGQPEQPRVLLVSVPYALKAVDAETLGGKPASAYVLTAPADQPRSASGGSGTQTLDPSTSLSQRSHGSQPAVGGTGTVNYIPIWINSTTLGNATSPILYETGGKLGVGTTAPAGRLDVAGNGRDIVIGDPGCGAGNGGIGFGGLSGCNNYSLLGNGFSTYLNRPTGGSLYFREGNLSQMVISPGGKVGVGTTTPAGRLDVAGNGRDIVIGDPGCGAGNGGIGFGGLSGCTNYSLVGNGFSTYLNRSSGGTLFFREGNVDQMTIAPGGLVSVTATPVGAIALNALTSNTTLSGTSTGVWGQSNAPGSNGVVGVADAGADSFGVEGIAEAIDDNNGWAGYFAGQVRVTGRLVSGVKDFEIDHPQDPANKYLLHSSVESSEMMNIYTGNIVLDNSGQAGVELPGWFQAENEDFRYSLTAIGAPAPNLHVAEEISRNHFRIAGGGPGMKVSWQVTAIRQDAFAKANPLVVEQDKPTIERGYYLHPELFGQPEGKAVIWAHRPDQLKQLKAQQPIQ